MAESIGGLITYIGSSGAAASAATAVATSAVGAGINAALAPKGGVTIPPPPGTAMVDPKGQQAAAMLRQRQAIAGGLAGTITGAGTGPAAAAAPVIGNATSGSKGLLGQ
ncbi:MAG: hypothetical protein ACLQO1_01660 [Steroidobacteraceae bacterium]